MFFLPKEIIRNKVFYFSLLIILSFALTIRLIPTRNNNFYFTMDQGDEAVRARELWFRHKIPFQGQGSSFPQIYHGPFWIWFISIGYWAFRGHPFGALFMLMFFKLSIIAYFMWWIYKNISLKLSLLVGVSLQFFWPFYDSSRYAFSPFPLVSLAILLLIWLTSAWEKKKWKMYVLSAIPIGLVFHSELASFPAFFFFGLIVGISGAVRKKWKFEDVFIFICLLGLFFIPFLITELKNGFPQIEAYKRLVLRSNVFSPEKLQLFINAFIKDFAESILHIKYVLSGIFVGSCIYLYLKFRGRMASEKSYIVEIYSDLVLVFFLVSLIWFGLNSGRWSSWHTVYIAPLIFTAVLLAIYTLPRKISWLIFIVVITTQIYSFVNKYEVLTKHSGDPSLLANELGAIDWIYQKADGQGFYVYSYLPSVNDYPYQYLFWWYGRKKYGYVPCEYSTYPGTPSLFVPGLENYQNPKRDCKNLRFAIIEPDKNKTVQDAWLSGVHKGTTFIDKSKSGSIEIEQLAIK